MSGLSPRIWKSPQNGNLAFTWNKNPEHRETMGWMEWVCPSTPNVMFQDFENGRIVGSSRGTLHNDIGMIYILLTVGFGFR